MMSVWAAGTITTDTDSPRLNKPTQKIGKANQHAARLVLQKSQGTSPTPQEAWSGRELEVKFPPNFQFLP